MFGLLFDMDGVIVDTEALIARASIDMFRDLYGAELTPEDFRPFIGTGAVRYVEGPAEALGLAIDIDRAVQVRHENFVKLLDAGMCKPCTGVLDLIHTAADNPDWKVAIATSSPSDKAAATLKAAKIPTDRFDIIINGTMVTHKKPHPEIYELTASRLALEPRLCVVIEDAITGTEAAKRAGMKCVCVTSSFSAEELAQADLVVASLDEIDLDALRAMVE
jgi:HAD superfamily hydrolase (TIGR01509 family)